MSLKILGIETSCDDTAASVVEDGSFVHSNIVASQADIHANFGGIVPEVASRQHMTTLVPVVTKALVEANLELGQLDGVAVTNGPGLAGSLLIGLNTAKGLAMAKGLPFMGINHLEGHIYAAWLEGLDPGVEPGFPLLCLIASGGHTDLILMHDHGNFCLIARSRDDAAGEAFDKGARVLGLGFPGGPEIQRVAENANGYEAPFPRPQVKGSLDFSFSGLKTSLFRRAQDRGWYPLDPNVEHDPKEIATVAAAYQTAIIDTLVYGTLKALEKYHVRGVLLGGGVAANRLLRKVITERSPVPVVVPKPAMCTDNGAMIGGAAWFHLRNGRQTQWDLDVIPNLRLG